MPPPQHSLSLGHSENGADYRHAFLRKVHRLLQLGYESLSAGDYQSAEEDDITGDICKHLKYLTEVAPTERWMSRFSVHDQDPSNNVVRPSTGKVRKGKNRPKIDIRLVGKHRLPNQTYWIEAKRLYRSDSVSEYAGGEGVGAFLCGEYGKDESVGGMVGYIQSHTLSYWLPKVEAKVTETAHSGKGGGTVSPWTAVKFAGGPGSCFATCHGREDGSSITLYHVMFIFTKPGD